MDQGNFPPKDLTASISSAPLAPVNLNFKERMDIVETIVSMFPMLEKDTYVYKILDTNNWSIEKCISQLQKRHDAAEKQMENRKNGVVGPIFTEDMEDDLDDEALLAGDEHHLDGLKESGMMDDDDLLGDDEDLEDEEEGGEKEMMMEAHIKYPKLKEDIKTIQDIFGAAYDEYELKGFYVMMGGNIELVIDHLVTEQQQIERQKNQLKPTEAPPPRQPLTSRLTEEEKRALQLQLIEEQEKLEKKFSDQKNPANHPTKKSYSQKEVLSY
eukprot:gene167-197_t